MFAEFLSFIVGKLIFFCASIAGDSFPKPLSKEEERKYLIAFKNGDMQAKERLIKHNLRLVAHIVKKYQGAYDNEDLISVGTIGLVKAINTYDFSKGAQLATYTARCIENEILMLLRANKKYKADVSISEVVGCDKDGNELSLMDLLSIDEESVLNQVEQNLFYEKLIKTIKECLTEREFTVIVLRFGLKGNKPLCQREVSALLKISRSYISRIEKKSIEKIKEYISKNNINLQ
ncbi:MAG: sigma-70 family RNA polymerase sigma factor [Clostridiales bacterium]|nr:sigma-70 family RNA polymerase sigma factor [Clostridiales bacterium]